DRQRAVPLPRRAALILRATGVLGEPLPGEAVVLELLPDGRGWRVPRAVPVLHRLPERAPRTLGDEPAHVLVEAEARPDLRGEEVPQHLAAALAGRDDGVRPDRFLELTPSSAASRPHRRRRTVERRHGALEQLLLAPAPREPEGRGELEELGAQPVPAPQLGARPHRRDQRPGLLHVVVHGPIVAPGTDIAAATEVASGTSLTAADRSSLSRRRRGAPRPATAGARAGPPARPAGPARRP